MFVIGFIFCLSFLNPMKVLAFGNGFTYSRSVTIDHTKISSTDQTNFPVLVSGVYSYLATVANSGKVQNASGYDIGFYTNSDCSTGKMSWETENYSSTTGTVNYWVKVPSVSASTDTVFYICYGNASITTDQSVASSVWDSGFKGVWHLADGTTLSANDSSSSSRNGTLFNSPTAIAGKIGGAASFSSAFGRYIGLVDDMNNNDSAGTVSAWIYPTTNTQQAIFCMTDSANNNNLAVVGILNSGSSPKLYMQALKIGDFNDAVATPDNSITLNTWTHVAFTADGSSYKIYINGVSQTLTVLSFTNSGRWFNTVPKTTGLYRIGYCNGGSTVYANSRYDDIKLSNTARSSDWIKTEYNNQSATSTFYSISSESTASVPVLTTDAPTSVSTSTLTLNATITSTGGADATQSGFAYGTSTNLDTVIATSTLGAQSGATSFTSGITNLTPSTTYYFRAYSTNSAGTAYGSILSTTTLAISTPNVSVSAATNVNTTSATINGIINSTGGDTVTSRGFEWGIDVSYGTIISNNGSFDIGPFSFDLVGLTCSTTYYFRAYSTNSVGTASSTGSTFTTSSCPVASIDPNQTSGGRGRYINNSIIIPTSNNVIVPQDRLRIVPDSLISSPATESLLGDLAGQTVTIKDDKSTQLEFIVVQNDNQSITLGSNSLVGTDGKVKQKTKVPAGKSITLSLKPVSAASTIKGYLLFKNQNQTASRESSNFANAADVVLSRSNITVNTSKDLVRENELVVNSFEYTDLDGDGVYNARISLPANEGEYEVLSIINYQDPKKNSKEIRMTTIVSPEGYVYRSNNGEETRISNATVSVWSASGELWNATQYNQDNPVITDKTGKYSFLLPTGKYYMTVEANGYETFRGEEFEVTEGSVIHENIELLKIKSWLSKTIDVLFSRINALIQTK